jgi:hypothetical protein
LKLDDFSQFGKDPLAKARIEQITNELYISAPYFTSEEAALIKATVVTPHTLNEIPEFEALELEDDTDNEIKGKAKESAVPEAMTIEEALQSRLQNFLKKRKASGDARPCGAHDMVPVYKAVFEITAEELKNEEFLSRLR